MKANAAVVVASLIVFSGCDGADRDLPARYRSLEVPAVRLRDPDARARGEVLFAQNCALCHGEAAGGDGVRRTGFARPPTNLRDPAWQAQATPRRVFAVIREGVPASGMPAWVGLDGDQTWDLVAHVLSLGGGGAS
jgi:high-affinity iron transporter